MFVANAPGQTGHQYIVVDPEKHAHGLAQPDPRELFQVQVHDNLVPVRHIFPRLTQRIVRATPGPEPKARVREHRIEDRVQNLPDRLLHQTIHHGGDARLAFPAARFGDRYTPYRLWLVTAVQ